MRDRHHSTSNPQEMWTAAVCWRGAFTTRMCWGATPSSQAVRVILGLVLLWPDTHWGTHVGIQAHADIWNSQNRHVQIKRSNSLLNFYSMALYRESFLQQCSNAALFPSETQRCWHLEVLMLAANSSSTHLRLPPSTSLQITDSNTLQHPEHVLISSPWAS